MSVTIDWDVSLTSSSLVWNQVTGMDWSHEHTSTESWHWGFPAATLLPSIKQPSLPSCHCIRMLHGPNLPFQPASPRFLWIPSLQWIWGWASRCLFCSGFSVNILNISLAPSEDRVCWKEHLRDAPGWTAGWSDISILIAALLVFGAGYHS